MGVKLSDVIIRKFRESEIEEIKYLQPNGWSDIRNYFELYTSKPFCFPIAAEIEDEIVGIATGIMNVKSGWVAHIIVSPDHYRKGIGKLLTQSAVDNLKVNGCETILLIATEMGAPLYTKLGFREVCTYKFFKGPKIITDNKFERVSKIVTSDHKFILELDKKLSGEVRNNMLADNLASGWILKNKNEIEGYYLPDLDEGTILAINDKAGLELLEFKHSRGEFKTTLPENNKAGVKFLLEHGFENHLNAPRMILGKDLNWKPESVFARIGGFYA